ncbi:MAG TPA: putative colanic acid biosynthesis acetyltransferase [Stellaceae bacterium]|nr:putative colanic acid biosynthesis acetyltransferase [Stellaceae bacterium]
MNIGPYQDLSRFRVPERFRGRSAAFVQLWWLVEATLFRPSPQILFGWRRFLLRLFGAQIGRGVLIRPSVEIVYPWKVSIGDYSWIGDHAVLYSLGEIHIGAHSVISQRCYLCTGSHDPESAAFDIFALPIRIGSQCWLATDVFVAPGITIADAAVVGARSSVFRDLPAAMICHGSPAQPVRRRGVARDSGAPTRDLTELQAQTGR